MHVHTHTHTHTCTHTPTHTHFTNVAPSGYILSKTELQVLASLLATYSDEKLKEIKLSIQEEQEVGRISREEVERSLRQSGMTSLADDLKDSIEKGRDICYTLKSASYRSVL